MCLDIGTALCSKVESELEHCRGTGAVLVTAISCQTLVLLKNFILHAHVY